MKKNIKLSISLLVSNSIDTIEKCMESLQPILQNVSSELIVVDTGGTDGSIEIAKKYATKVVPFVWCNDFAKARNAGLREARGEWFLFLDDDEWFNNVTPIIEFFNSGEYLKYNSAGYGIRNYVNKQGTSWEQVPTYRMVKIEKETRFVSPIHEMLRPIRFPEKRLDCFVHHYGYAYDSEEEARKHSYRNIPLLKEVLEKTPDEYRMILQLVKEYCVIKEYEMAEQISWDAVHRLQESKDFTKYNVRMVSWILSNIVRIKTRNKDLDQAIINAEEFINYEWVNEITKNNLYYNLITLYYEKKEYEKCLKYIPFYETTYNNLIGNLEYRRGQAILEQEDIVKESILSSLYTLGIFSASEIGNRDLAIQYIDKMLNVESTDKTQKEAECIFKYLLEEENGERKSKIVEHLFKNSETADNVSKIMDGDFFNEAQIDEICMMVSGIDSNNIKILPYHIYEKHLKGNIEEVKKYLDFYAGHEDNILNIMHPLLKLIEIYNIDIVKLIESKDIKTWTKQQNNFVIKATEKKVEAWINLLETYPKRGFNSNMLYMRCLEKKMRGSDIENVEYKEMQDMLKKYSSAVREVYNNIYQEEAFGNQYSIFLPKNCQFVEKVKNVVNQRIGKIETARILKEAAEIYPEMADFCKHFILKLQESEKNEAKKEQDEFIKLGEMIKEKIRAFINQGEYEAAKQTLNQLKVMLPNDLELLELECNMPS